MRKKRRLLLLALAAPAALLLSQTVIGQASDTGGFYQRDAEGWFWYVDPERDEEEEEAPPPPAPPSSEPSKSGPPALSSAWMRENLPKYRDLAIDNPTTENVAAYYYLQRYMLDKSERFARVSNLVVSSDPFLDENTRRPIASFASMAANRSAKENQVAVLKELAGQAGLWFFFHSECSFCEQQAPILEMMERIYGFTVKAVSLDGKPLPSGRYPDFIVDRGQAKQLNVAGTPAMFLVVPPDKVVPIAQGLLSASQIGERAIQVAASAGFISDEAYASTQVARMDMLMDTGMDKAKGLTESDTRDTRKLVRYMKSLYGAGMNPYQGGKQ